MTGRSLLNPLRLMINECPSKDRQLSSSGLGVEASLMRGRFKSTFPKSDSVPVMYRIYSCFGLSHALILFFY